MKFGHRILGKITGYDDKGRGVFELPREREGAYDQGKGTVAIPFAAEGDDVVATFLKRDHGIKVAKLESITTPGPDRVSTPCPHAGVCGGCLWQHLSTDAQLRLKRDMVNGAFEKAGHMERVAEVLPAEKQFQFRNRMDYAVGWNSEIGLKEYGSWNRYIDLTTCLLLDADVGKLLEAVRIWMREGDLQPWDAKFYTGDVRYVVVREGKNTGQRMITIVTKDLSRITDTHRSRLTDVCSRFCTSLLLGEQPKITDISISERFEALKGNPWLEEEVNGVRYRIAPNSFFQTNTAMAGRLQEVVKELIGSPSTSSGNKLVSILDLYCGLGFFGIALAKNDPGIRVTGIELDADAIELAKHNASANGVADRCEFFAAPAEDLSWKHIAADTVILDPPRSGLHPRVMKTLLDMRPPSIVYVSCNYRRLVEELKEFKTAYRVETIHALDLFPHTPHVEIICALHSK